MVDLFSPEGIERMLCVVAHPDDMEYGASAAVAEWTARGVEVAYLLLTAGEAGIRDMYPAEVGPLRAKEQRKACEIVGVEHLTILDLPDGMLEPSIEVRSRIAGEIRRFRPQAVMCTSWELEVPWGLNHADHRAAGLATVDAIRDADNPWIFPQQLSEGLTAWSTRWLLVTGSEPTHAIELSRESVEKGVASLEAHEVYLRALPGHIPPREIVEGAAASGAAALRETRSAADEGGTHTHEYALGVRAIAMG